jgi:NAD(P)-dependent dehydrogenase (short-subunit alcohol dehydrogenase family)
MPKHILITGVSTGIGYAAAADLVRRGYHVFGSVRQQADADRLQAELGHMFAPLLFDVTDGAGVQTAVSHLATSLNGQPLTALINNAGISIPGPLMYMPIDEFRWQLEVNVVGLLNITQQCLSLLGARPDAPSPKGRIINISSVSGQIAYPFMGAYAASKHALEAMSDALRRELLLYGVDVILIEPGTVRTPIVGKFAEQVARYAHTDYAPILKKIEASIAERERTAMPVERVTAVLRTALESPNPKTRYPIPRKRLTGWLLPRWLPDRWLDKIIGRELGLKQR